MGLSFSRSVRFGPVRFNFSGSGIGMSTGIRGLRIGTGPRGAYINAGLGGFRYRTSLGARTGAPVRLLQPAGQPGVQPVQVVPGSDANIQDVHDHDTVSVLALSDSSSDALLASMNEQAQKVEVWRIVGGVALAAFAWGQQFVSNHLAWLDILVLAAMVAGVLWLRHYEQMRSLTVLFFEPDAAVSGAFANVVAGAQQVLNVNTLKAVAQTARVIDSRYEAGAGRLVKLGNASVAIGQVPRVLANVDVPVLRTGRTTLAFYPDRVLAFQGKTVGAISYWELQIASEPTTFIEAQSVPGDATVIGQTWQYVNRNGTPDRRFKNNRQIPVCRYNSLQLSSARGLDVRFQASRAGAFDQFAAAVRAMAAVTRKA